VLLEGLEPTAHRLEVGDPFQWDFRSKSWHDTDRRMGDVSEYLAVYLGDPGAVPGIGPERGRKPTSGIGRFKSPHGSVRYVWYEHGTPLAALQVVSRDGKLATIANVYTVPARRREGLAAALLARARRDFNRVTHAGEEHLSAEGRAWREKLG
jgi:GNAT superfamily N-acetyltransferase